MVRLQHEAEAAQAHRDRATLAATEIEGSKIRQQLLDVTNEVAELYKRNSVPVMPTLLVHRMVVLYSCFS